MPDHSTRTTHATHNIGVAEQIGKYSDAIETAPDLRWLFTAGTPGLSPDGMLSVDFSEQARQAWTNIMSVLETVGMGVEDIVKVSTTLVRAEDIAANALIRASFLGDARPAFMLAVIDQLVRPDILIEVEVIAAKA
ncbi:Rid family hydrolase [Variovorax sp. J22R133]|uniref:RidA family protein n=1 Tax=Variovorax brevis TaxID=3053503 RepID=UPI0025783928|nr:Rid family hydrolase [Variovorax sp. J22R133]MDM0114084.1 Rid family hydrolase [Variovorax sp. J22R133]